MALAATLMALTALGAGPALAASAGAEPLTDCSATTGAIVAVDFAHWGGPVLRACGTTPTTGYAQLNQGGWHTAGTEHDGPGFICRIGYAGYQHAAQYPTPAEQACVQTPPVSAYWAAWVAAPGQTTWTYSQLGALAEQPAPGSVTVWIFGGTDLAGTAGSARPAFTPQALRTAATGTTLTPGLEIKDAPPVTASASASISRGSPWPTVTAVAIALLLAAIAAQAARRRKTLRP